MDRRGFLRTVGLGAMVLENGLWVEAARTAAADVLEVDVVSSYAPGLWFFDPPGLYVQLGQTVRWSAGRWGPTVTAFHPANDNRELRIPEGAKPFSSNEIGGERTPLKTRTFQWTFDVEGTYDYYSRNHEVLGLVGRIVVGKPGGPGEKPAGYGGREGRWPMYPKAAQLLEFLKSDQIVEKKTIPFPRQLFEHKFPG